MDKTRIAVIGGGPGGYVAAIRASQLGAEVTLIEKQHLGGTCLNVGCIPTKALLHTAEIYEQVKNGADYGVIAEAKLDYIKAQQKKKAIIETMVKGVKSLLVSNKVKIIFGEASFIDKNTLKVVSDKEESITYDKIIIASGSIPLKPLIPGIDTPNCIDSTGALGLDHVPKSMLIVGGGVIGVELATLYASLGSKITIIETLEQILPLMDGELTALLREKLEKIGIAIYTSSRVTTIVDRNGLMDVHVAFGDGNKQVFGCEKVLISAGRCADTAGLALEKAGIANNRGYIIVDARMETNVRGVYAIGDCNGKVMLAHAASAQGEVAAENAMGQATIFNDRTSPSCVYTNPEFASVGLTEGKARRQGIACVTGKFPFVANGKALIMNGGESMMKIIAGAEFGEILGVHILGPRATDVIGECALAIGMEATTDDIIATIHAHPTVTEAIRETALAVHKRAIHMPNK